MKAIKTSWWPLLCGLCLARPALAQAPPSAAPCLRAYCGSLAEPSGAALLKSGAAARPPANWQPSGERDWNSHIGARERGEDYHCLLSFGFGGELRAYGYRGVRLLGQTRTVAVAP